MRRAMFQESICFILVSTLRTIKIVDFECFGIEGLFTYCLARLPRRERERERDKTAKKGKRKKKREKERERELRETV